MALLAGDIGGTKTHLAIYKEDKGSLYLELEEKFPSQHYLGLEFIVQEFLDKHPEHTIKKACFGVAGAVRNGVCKPTNLPWILDEKKLKASLSFESLAFLNDLEANAYGLKYLKEDELFVLNAGSKFWPQNQALISAGTGLGEAGLYYDGHMHRPFACEGGHCDFAPRNELEVELFYYLREKFQHVSYERVLSGPGLVNLYNFLAQKRNIAPFKQEEGIDLAKTISAKALDGSCAICKEALDWFCSFYGAEAGNAALKFYALGGIFLGGGIAPKILKVLQDGSFLKAFTDKGRFKDFLSQIPIYVVLNENTALIGAAYYAHYHLNT